MSFQPVLPLSGYAGWRLLERTMERQRASHDQTPQIQKDVDYFAAKIGSVRTPEDLVSDYRLLKVALGAFGLEEAINGKALIKKVLTDGTTEKTALANRLSDKRWHALAKAFALDGTGSPGTASEGFAKKITEQFRTRSFETAVGNLDENMGLALSLNREIGALASETMSENAKWFSILGSKSLRAVFDGAFGLPQQFASVDLDRQLAVYKDKAQAMFGSNSASQFKDAESREKLIKTFLVRSEISAGSTYSSGQIALTLLAR